MYYIHLHDKDKKPLQLVLFPVYNLFQIRHMAELLVIHHLDSQIFRKFSYLLIT